MKLLVGIGLVCIALVCVALGSSAAGWRADPGSRGRTDGPPSELGGDRALLRDNWPRGGTRTDTAGAGDQLVYRGEPLVLEYRDISGTMRTIDGLPGNATVADLRREIRAATGVRGWRLVPMDGVGELGEDHALLRDYWPRGGTHTITVTGRLQGGEGGPASTPGSTAEAAAASCGRRGATR